MAVQDLRRRLPRAEREEQLLGIATELFADRGFRIPSMDEIALAAGVTKPVLYDHFGSKDGLIAACIRRAGEELLVGVAAAVEGAASPEATFRAGVAAFFDFVESHGLAWFSLVGDNSVTGPAARAVEEVRQQQADYVAAQLAEGFPDLSAADLAVISEAIIGACERLALWRRDRPEVSPAAARESLTSLLWSGLAARLPA